MSAVVFKKTKTGFKLDGFRVFQRGNCYYIEYARNKKRTLKTSKEKIALDRAAAFVELYNKRKIQELKDFRKTPISDYLKTFLENKDFDSDKTEKIYQTSINMFIKVLGDKSIRTYLSEDIAEFKRTLRKKRFDKKKGTVSKRSINTYLRHIKAVFRQAKDDGYIMSVPKIQMFKVDDLQPVILSKDNKEKLFGYLKENDPEFYRICKFALFTGCRRSEIINARWENFEGFTLRVVGKGKKERTIPLVPQAKIYMGKQKKSGPIFWQAHPDTYTHYFKKYMVACGIFNISFHKMRHTAATEMLEAEIPMEIVQKVLGHTDIATTKIYAHVMRTYLQKQMEKYGEYLAENE
ncbi:MAG TPA: site-specific integrase [Desulfotignum sp.]|nr:site-specific integrase [Desulfotignum sp.]